MSTDPLSADRRSLVVQAEHVASQLADERSWPYLRRVGVDPADLLSRLRAATTPAREALAHATNSARQRRALRQRADAALKKVGSWQIGVRAALQAVPLTEVSRIVVRELRTLVAPSARRLPSTISMLRAAVDRLRAHAPVLPGVDVGLLTTAAETLLAELDAHRKALDAAIAARAQAVSRSQASITAMRRLLREVRGAWRFAQSMAGGAMLDLDLSVARAAIGQRADVRPEGPRDDSEGAEGDSGRAEDDSDGAEDDLDSAEDDS